MHLFGTRIFYPKGARFRKFFREIFTLGLYDESSIRPKSFDEPYSDLIGDQFAGSVINGMNVSNRRNTNILEITFNSINADESRRVAGWKEAGLVSRHSVNFRSDALQLVVL